METNRKIIIIILILFGAIALAIATFFLWPSFFGGIASLQPNNFKLGEIALFQPNHFKLQKANIVPGSKKTKRMDEKGGILNLVDRKGTKITVNIPAGALEKETEITLAELAASPIPGQDGNLGQGIFLGPIDIQFKKPALIIFDFNPQNEQPLQPVPASQVSAGMPSPATPVDDGLTEAERTRHQNASGARINEHSGVLRTDSTEDRAGDSVYLAPSVRNQEAGEIESAVSEGGTYSADGEIAKADAKALAESILENPNATSEQILEAWSMAQLWGFDDVEGRAKDKMKNRIDEETRKISENCENENRIKVSKKAILQLQGLAQQLGMREQEQKLGELLQSCRAYYSFEISSQEIIFESLFDGKFLASVCGFIDDEWKASYDEKTTFDIGEGIKKIWDFNVEISGLHLKPGGGSTNFTYTGIMSFAYIPPTTIGPVSSTIEFDGINQVRLIPFRLIESKPGQVTSQKQCVADNAPF